MIGLPSIQCGQVSEDSSSKCKSLYLSTVPYHEENLKTNSETDDSVAIWTPYHNINRFSGSCWSHKQHSLLVGNKKFHQVCVADGVFRRHDDFVECSILTSTVQAVCRALNTGEQHHSYVAGEKQDQKIGDMHWLLLLLHMRKCVHST